MVEEQTIAHEAFTERIRKIRIDLVGAIDDRFGAVRGDHWELEQQVKLTLDVLLSHSARKAKR